jgi:hypothetical protein
VTETYVLIINGDVKSGRVKEGADSTENKPDVPKFMLIESCEDAQ